MSMLQMSAIAAELHRIERIQVESLYASAVVAARGGYPQVAKGFGNECVARLRRLGTGSLQECAACTTTLQGVPIPEFLHEEVVTARLAAYDVNLAA